MRRLVLTALLVVAPAAVAQNPMPVPATPPGVPAAGYEMPGTTVGKPSVQPVGSPVGSRLPDVGTRLPPAVSKSPFTGNWPTVDPNLVIAPYPTKSDPADFWDRLQQRWMALFTPPPPRNTGWFPSLSRRARERKEREREMLERRLRD